MSRIFDALQKLGVEHSGVEYPDLISVVTLVLEDPADTAHVLKEPVAQVVTTETTDFASTASAIVESPIVEMPTVTIPLPKAVEQKPLSGILANFPTLHVRTELSSRLVTVTDPQSLAAEKFRFLGVRL